ncbi:MAG: hypothetical protein KJ906_01170 [Nanoarchaeota archaeon]|nr:hypothetical protein [Nanoarchaeota archaeon]
MRIGIDVDQVLLDILPPLLEYHNERYGTNSSVSELASRNLAQVWNCDQKETLKRIHDFYNTKYFNKVVPITGAVKSAQQLAKNYELYTVTSRTIKHADKTVKQIEKHFPNIFDMILFDNEYNNDTIDIRKKIEVCQDYNLKILVDDHAKNLRDIPSNMTGILFDRPWNQKETPKDVIRAYDWKGVIELIEKI